MLTSAIKVDKSDKIAHFWVTAKKRNFTLFSNEIQIIKEILHYQNIGECPTEMGLHWHCSSVFIDNVEQVLTKMVWFSTKKRSAQSRIMDVKDCFTLFNLYHALLPGCWDTSIFWHSFFNFGLVVVWKHWPISYFICAFQWLPAES